MCTCVFFRARRKDVLAGLALGKYGIIPIFWAIPIFNSSIMDNVLTLSVFSQALQMEDLLQGYFYNQQN